MKNKFWRLSATFFMAGMAMSGCSTSLGTQSTSSYFIPNQSQNAVFRNVVQATVRSGLTLTSTDYDAGIIIAEAPRNPILTFEATKLNIFVNETGGGSMVSLSSILGGQVVDYGSSANAISRFCNAFRQSYPAYVNC